MEPFVGELAVTYLPQVSEYLSAIWLNTSALRVRDDKVKDVLTPARTLVMSSTLMPASGKLGELCDGGTVARPRYWELLEPLTVDRESAEPHKLLRGPAPRHARNAAIDDADGR